MTIKKNKATVTPEAGGPGLGKALVGGASGFHYITGPPEDPPPHIPRAAVFSWHRFPPSLYPQRTPLSNSDAQTSESESQTERPSGDWTHLCLVLGDMANMAVLSGLFPALFQLVGDG